MAALGRYSYGIYIWHVFAAQLALDWLPGMDYGVDDGPGAQLAKYGAAIAAGVLATVAGRAPGAAAARPAGPARATAGRRRPTGPAPRGSPPSRGRCAPAAA